MPLSRRQLDALPREPLHVARNWSKADVYRVRWPNDQSPAVLKDMKACPLWFRLIAGRAFLEREWRALKALEGVPGVPRALARPDADSLLMEECHGTPAMEFRRGQMPLAALVSLAEVVARSHERGVTHGDMHRDNILVREDGGVTLIDWATACVFGSQRHGPKSWTWDEWRNLDLRAVAKLKARHAPQLLDAADRELLLGGSRAYRVVRSFGHWGRVLRGHQKTHSPGFAAARYREQLETAAGEDEPGGGKG